METYKEDHVQSGDDAGLVTQLTKVRSSLLPTVVVGLAMLMVGMLVGYLGHPLIAPQLVAPRPVAVTDAGAPAAAAVTNPSAGNPSPANLMDAVAAETRHFKGDPNAPVMIIEFGDFK